MRLEGKHIILGVTGSIAAYKAAYLLRLLVKEGAKAGSPTSPPTSFLSILLVPSIPAV